MISSFIEFFAVNLSFSTVFLDDCSFLCISRSENSRDLSCGASAFVLFFDTDDALLPGVN